MSLLLSCRDLRALLEPIAELVPDLTAYFNVRLYFLFVPSGRGDKAYLEPSFLHLQTDDLPARSATYDLRSRSRELAIAGERTSPAFPHTDTSDAYSVYDNVRHER
jgi:hypothetical protein